MMERAEHRLLRVALPGVLAAMLAFLVTTAALRARETQPAQAGSARLPTTREIQRRVQEDMQLRLPDPVRPGERLLIGRVDCRRPSPTQAACVASPLDAPPRSTLPVAVTVDQRSGRILWRLGR
jgi:hypothetical protein